MHAQGPTIRKLLMISVIVLISPVLFSQAPIAESTQYAELIRQMEERQGVNDELINGVYYEELYRNALGHPFFAENKFYTGTVVYKDREYRNIPIRYDLYNQDIMINHPNKDVLLTTILADDFISGFAFDRFRFSQHLVEGKFLFLQHVAEFPSVSCYYHWYKGRRKSFHLGDIVSYAFSDDLRKNYLLLGNTYYTFSSRHSFLKTLPKDVRGPVRRHIREKKWNLNRLSDEHMESLISHIDTLLSE